RIMPEADRACGYRPGIARLRRSEGFAVIEDLHHRGPPRVLQRHTRRARNAFGQRLEAADPDGGYTEAHRQPARRRHGEAQSGEISRPGADRKRIEIVPAEARLRENLLEQWQQPLGLAA